jgi:hypothetical protein
VVKKKTKRVKPEIIEAVETIEDQAEFRYQGWKADEDEFHLIIAEDDWEPGNDFISRSFYYTGTDDPGEERVGTYRIRIQDGMLKNTEVIWAEEE